LNEKDSETRIWVQFLTAVKNQMTEENQRLFRNPCQNPSRDLCIGKRNIKTRA